MAKNGSSPFLGVLFIFVGFMFLFKTMGVLDFSFWQYFSEYWPVGVIVAGIAILGGRRDVGGAVLLLTMALLFVYGIGHSVGSLFDFSSQEFESVCMSGSGNLTDETREVVDFTKIKAASGVNVHIVKGTIGTVRVTGDDNIVEVVDTEVRNGELLVGIGSCTRNREDVDVYVTVDEVERIEATSGATVDSEKVISAEVLKLDASAAGSIDIEVEAGELEIEASTASVVGVSGETDKLYAEASSSSRIDAEELIARDVRAKSSTASEVIVYASERINADASSAARIEYSGDPTDVNVEESTTGSVVKVK